MNKIKIKIIQDIDAQSPRDWDNLGTMACWHDRYNLGDENGQALLLDDIRSDKNYRESWDDYMSDHFRDLSDPRMAIETAEELGFVILKLYLYDHSGITMNTTGFSCPWDSGQVGIIYVTREKIREEYSVKRISPELLARVNKYLKGEVETYDQFICNDVWGFDISEVDKDDEEVRHIDSCWGFYGDDPKINGMHERWSDEHKNIIPETVWAYEL